MYGVSVSSMRVAASISDTRFLRCRPRRSSQIQPVIPTSSFRSWQARGQLVAAAGEIVQYSPRKPIAVALQQGKETSAGVSLVQKHGNDQVEGEFLLGL